ncbi:OmpA family protein [Ralstonia sp. Ralssp135]|uniref:OmpA family protein n=1 Tax=Ralstonia sp. Ralssp135 TaxID=3243016 RepID=UPI0039B11B9F
MRTPVTFLILIAALSVPAGSLAFEKLTNGVDLSFAPGSAQLTTAERVKLVRLLEMIKEKWCPLEGVGVSSHVDATEAANAPARAALAKKRADEVVSELKAFGVPSHILYAESDKHVARPLPWTGIVEVEAVGGSYQMPCPSPQNEHGFHVPAGH